MSELEKKKKRLELARVQLAREELEFKVEERMDEIERLKAAIQIQLEKEEEIRKDLKM